MRVFINDNDDSEKHKRKHLSLHTLITCTQAGSRPGALIATAWAAMVRMGEEGYLDSTKKLMAAVDRLACCA